MTPVVSLLRAFCCIYIHMQIVLLGGRANAIDETAEASRSQGSVDTIPRDGKASRLSAPYWHCQPMRWECTEVLAIYRPLSDVSY